MQSKESLEWEKLAKNLGTHLIDYGDLSESKGSSLKGWSQTRTAMNYIPKIHLDRQLQKNLPPDVDRLRLELKDHNGTVRNVLNYCVESSTLESVSNFAFPQLDRCFLNQIRTLSALKCWWWAVPKAYEVWASYHDRHIAHLHQFIGWSGFCPSEVLKLLWVDVDLAQRFYIKRDTKSSNRWHSPWVLSYILFYSSNGNCWMAHMRTSSLSSGPAGGQRKLHSYIHTSAVWLTGIPKTTGQITASWYGSFKTPIFEATDEVAYQLGHSPGSPMTRRYARFLESAQRGIADRTQRVMDEMLNWWILSTHKPYPCPVLEQDFSPPDKTYCLAVTIPLSFTLITIGV